MNKNPDNNNNLDKVSNEQIAQKILNNLILPEGVRKKILLYSKEDVPLLLTGPTGTGKTSSARAIHHLSDRADKPFVTVNSSIIDGELMASHLFGHVKGSFTGAIGNRDGLFAKANGGTVFLDDLQAITGEAQCKLLEVIENREFSPVGSDKKIKADVRVIAALSHDPAELYKQGKLNLDFMSRVAGYRINFPSIAESDIETFKSAILLARTKLGISLEAISEDAAQMLFKHVSAGNFREIERAIHAAYILSKKTRIEARHMNEAIRDSVTSVLSISRPPACIEHSLPDIEIPKNKTELQKAVKKFKTIREKEMVQSAYKKTHCNISRGASLVDYSRKYFRNKLIEYGIMDDSSANDEESTLEYTPDILDQIPEIPSDNNDLKNAEQINKNDLRAAYYISLLIEHSGNVAEIARSTNTERTTIFRILNNLNISADDYRKGGKYYQPQYKTASIRDIDESVKLLIETDEEKCIRQKTDIIKTADNNTGEFLNTESTYDDLPLLKAEFEKFLESLNDKYFLNLAYLAKGDINKASEMSGYKQNELERKLKMRKIMIGVFKDGGGKEFWDKEMPLEKSKFEDLLWNLRRQYLTKLMLEAKGNSEDAANISGYNREHILKALERHELKAELAEPTSLKTQVNQTEAQVAEPVACDDTDETEFIRENTPVVHMTDFKPQQPITHTDQSLSFDSGIRVRTTSLASTAVRDDVSKKKL